MTRRLFLLSAVMAVLAAGTSVAAHDLWIDPTAFRPGLGAMVGIRLRVGQDLIGDPVPRDPGLLERFVVASASGRQDVPGRDGADPAGLLRPTTPGLLVVGYQSHPSAITLPAEKFNAYLAEEGLDAITALRASRRQDRADARELFSRCAKSLILSGPADASQRDQALGFVLELMAERNPYTLDAGDDLSFQLLYRQQPLPNALVVALSRANPADKLTARTDREGRVRFRLGHAGLWLVKSVHMVPAAAGANADWASFWASLTFDLGGDSRRTAGR